MTHDLSDMDEESELEMNSNYSDIGEEAYFYKTIEAFEAILKSHSMTAVVQELSDNTIESLKEYLNKYY